MSIMKKILQTDEFLSTQILYTVQRVEVCQSLECVFGSHLQSDAVSFDKRRSFLVEFIPLCTNIQQYLFIYMPSKHSFL